MSRFASVVLDADNTVSGIEGIDWLAARRGTQIAERVSLLTNRAMNGQVPLEQVYGDRLKIIMPTRQDIEALAEAYLLAEAPDVGDVLRQLRDSRVRLVLVSGGIRQALLPMARQLGFDGGDLHAVTLHFNQGGEYAGYETRSPLVQQNGKAEIVRKLRAEKRLPSPVLAVGDGSTDIAMRPVVDAFAAYTGFVRREPVAGAADYELPNFTDLMDLVLS